MSDRSPLKLGEHVDLDSGVHVERAGPPNEGLYRLHVPDGPPTFLPRDELRVLAELAGFDVSDDGGGPP